MRDRSRELVETRAGVRPLGRAARLIDRRVVEPALLRLQRTYGNRFVQRLVRATDAGDMPADLERQIDQTRATGGPLESSVRAGMEAAFGQDFGHVRVHTGSEADNLSRAVSARAFTTGSDVFFANGEYAPESSAGRELIAHELAHVVQQAGGIRMKLTVGAADDEHEREADAVARAVVEGSFDGALGYREPDATTVPRPTNNAGERQ